MVTTAKAIRIIYDHLIKSGAKNLTGINGGIYWMSRPKASKLEDIVINSVAMNGAQMQEGVFNVNIHIPNLKLGDDNTQPNFARFESISSVLVNILGNVYGYSYNFYVEEPGTIVPDGDNWFCNIRLRFYTPRP